MLTQTDRQTDRPTATHTYTLSDRHPDGEFRPTFFAKSKTTYSDVPTDAYLIRVPSAHNPIQAVEGARRDEQDVRGVHGESFTSQSPRTPLRNADQGSLEHFQHALLNSLAADVA